ncbi:MAG: Two component signal transduction histidine kinase [Actinomycetia bacterium]|nr:Two component signal transduction histidine kinase [Actinomycetes bacterium]
MRMRARTRTLVAWSLWLITFGFCAAGLVVTLVVTRPLTAAVLADGAAFALVFPLGYATIGLVLGLRRPANPIGWLFAASGLVWSLPIPIDPWVNQLILDHRPLPLAAQLGALVGEYNWAPAVALGITLPALLVPDGRLRSRRWRPVAAAAVAGPVLGMVGGSLIPGQLEETVLPIDNPFGLAGVAGTVAAVVGFSGLGLWVASMLAALAALVLRFRASRGTERQQLRWVVAGATGAVAGLLVGMAGVVVTYFAVLCVPVGVAVAVLRYRLWDLDRLVSRTVTYAVVTALLVLPYLLILPAATRLFEGSGSLAVAAVTLAAAALFQPLRRRVQDLVDRRFNRRRYDAARTVEGFAVRLRDQLDLEALEGELLAVTNQTMQPSQASLWLRARPTEPGL